MAHDVFISYSNFDKPIADAVCAHLEGKGIRCWIAPRDILPGEDWPSAVTKAISQSRVMVLVFSASSNSSEDVGRELMLAANHKIIIIPFKIENVEPVPGKQYYLARTHWLDAVNPPTREQIGLLGETVKMFVENAVAGAEARAASDDHLESQIASSPMPLHAQQPVKMKKPVKKWVTWLYILVPVVLIALALVSRHFTGLVTPTMEPTASNTAIPVQTTAAPTVEPTATNTTIPTLTIAIPTVEPTASNLPIPTQLTMDVTISDSFDNNKNNWPMLQQLNDNGNLQDMKMQNSQLVWSIDCVLSTGCFYSQVPSGMPVVSDFDLSADVKRVPETTNGYSGLIFRFVNGHNYCMFVYDDSNSSFLIWKVVDDSVTNVSDWASSSAINSNEFNRLRVEALGSHFIFFINGIQVYSAEITGIYSGKVGVGGGNYTSGTTSLVFDNFNLRGATSR